jgi:hypothetical protein
MFWIRAEVRGRSTHHRDQPRLFHLLIGSESSLLCRELPFYSSPNQVRLARSSAMSNVFQSAAQFSREPHGDAIILHCRTFYHFCRTQKMLDDMP